MEKRHIHAVQGQGPFFHGGYGCNEDTAVLLIHGFTGSPAEFRQLGAVLNQQGYAVEAVLLPGHGTRPEDMIKTGWTDWWVHVLESYDRLRREGYGRIIAIGHSMGGLLALKLSMYREVAGVVAASAPIFFTSRKPAIAFWIQRFIKYIPKKRHPDSEAQGGAEEECRQESFAYEKTPVPCIVQLRRLMWNVKSSLYRVAAPVLVLQGEKDPFVKRESAYYIFDNVLSVRREIKLYRESEHGLLIEGERDQVYRDIADFCGSLVDREDFFAVHQPSSWVFQ